jgi:hypothetical protein
MLLGYGDTVLLAESLEKELNKARKHSAMLQSKLDGAFALRGSTSSVFLIRSLDFPPAPSSSSLGC